MALTTPPEKRPYSAEMFEVRICVSWTASSMMSALVGLGEVVVVDVGAVDQEHVVVGEPAVDLELAPVGGLLRDGGGEGGDLVDRAADRKLLDLVVVARRAVDGDLLRFDGGGCDGHGFRGLDAQAGVGPHHVADGYADLLHRGPHPGQLDRDRVVARRQELEDVVAAGPRRLRALTLLRRRFDGDGRARGRAAVLQLDGASQLAGLDALRQDQAMDEKERHDACKGSPHAMPPRKRK